MLYAFRVPKTDEYLTSTECIHRQTNQLIKTNCTEKHEYANKYFYILIFMFLQSLFYMALYTIKYVFRIWCYQYFNYQMVYNSYVSKIIVDLITTIVCIIFLSTVYNISTRIIIYDQSDE